MIFVLWSSCFIWKSSFIALDGSRYFCLFDDAMISMRYAQNLSNGMGLVWNAGERVEGYSNFLMVLIMAAANFLLGNSATVLAIQILGAAFILALAWLVMGIMDRVMESEGRAEVQGGHPVFPILAFAATLAYYPLNYWSLMGMETGLLALLLGAAVFQSMEFSRTGRGRSLYWIAACMGLVFMTRIDGLIFGFPIFVFLLACQPGDSPWRRRLSILIGPALVFLMLVALHEAFRLFYYGEFLPNTYYLKLTGMPLILRVRDGWAFIQPFLNETKILLVVALAAMVLRPVKERLFLGVLGSIAIAYQVWNGGDPWNYWRIMSPGMPFLFVLFILGLGSLARLKPVPKRESWVALLVISGVGVGIWKADRRFRREWTLRDLPIYVKEHAELVNNSLALGAVTDTAATLGVFWAGTPPYYAERKAVDFLGKNDRRIARMLPDTSGKVSWNNMRSVPGHNKYDLEYSIKTLRPTYVEGVSWGGQNLEDWARKHYVILVYKGVALHLLKDSPAVRWEKADAIIPWPQADSMKSF